MSKKEERELARKQLAEKIKAHATGVDDNGEGKIAVEPYTQYLTDNNTTLDEVKRLRGLDAEYIGVAHSVAGEIAVLAMAENTKLDTVKFDIAIGDGAKAVSSTVRQQETKFGTTKGVNSVRVKTLIGPMGNSFNVANAAIKALAAEKL